MEKNANFLCSSQRSFFMVKDFKTLLLIHTVHSNHNIDQNTLHLPKLR